MQQHTEQVVQIFRRLVAAKLTGSLSESARAYSDLDTLADHVAIVQNTTVGPRPGRVTGPARAGLTAVPVSTPRMRMPKTNVRPIATGARWAGRPATAVPALVGPHGCGPGTLGPSDRLAQYKEEP